jgi:phosphatidylglycerophosphatase A
MKRLITSCFGLGWLPIAPGTWGSMPVAMIYFVMSRSGASSAVSAIVMAVLAAAASIICVKMASAAMEATGKNDPGEVVIDEFAGQAMTFVVVSIASVNQVWIAAILGFLFFRFFDILKPWPVHNLEKLRAGWGILADDLAAGIYAGLAVLVCNYSGLIGYIGRFI